MLLHENIKDYLSETTHEQLTECLIAIEDLRSQMIMNWVQNMEQYEERNENHNSQRFSRLRLIR